MGKWKGYNRSWAMSLLRNTRVCISFDLYCKELSDRNRKNLFSISIQFWPVIAVLSIWESWCVANNLLLFTKNHTTFKKKRKGKRWVWSFTSRVDSSRRKITDRAGLWMPVLIKFSLPLEIYSKLAWVRQKMNVLYLPFVHITKPQSNLEERGRAALE